MESKALVSNPAPILRESHYCGIDYCVLACVSDRLCTPPCIFACHHSYGGAAVSKTLMGVYLHNRGVQHSPKQPRENTAYVCMKQVQTATCTQEALCTPCMCPVGPLSLSDSNHSPIFPGLCMWPGMMPILHCPGYRMQWCMYR